MSLRPFNSRNSVHVPSYKSIQYCAAVKRWECPTLRETMDLVHQRWYRRVSQTWCTAGTGGCQLQARRNAVRHPAEPPYTPWKPENTKWIKRRFNEYWNAHLSRWLQRRGRPGCMSHLGQTRYPGVPFWGRMCWKSKNIICWGEKEESKVSLWCRCKQKTASWC